jgi:hypothetical protein
VVDVKWGCHKQHKANFIERRVIEELRRRFSLDQFPRNHCSINGVPIHSKTPLFVKNDDAHWDL